jgi:hypothetical protein
MKISIIEETNFSTKILLEEENPSKDLIYIIKTSVNTFKIKVLKNTALFKTFIFHEKVNLNDIKVFVNTLPQSGKLDNWTWTLSEDWGNIVYNKKPDPIIIKDEYKPFTIPFTLPPFEINDVPNPLKPIDRVNPYTIPESDRIPFNPMYPLPYTTPVYPGVFPIIYYTTDQTTTPVEYPYSTHEVKYPYSTNESKYPYSTHTTDSIETTHSTPQVIITDITKPVYNNSSVNNKLFNTSSVNKTEGVPYPDNFIDMGS